MKKKLYITPTAEFEEIEGLGNLLDDLSKYQTEGSGTTADNNPEDMPWGGDTPGDDPNDDPNG